LRGDGEEASAQALQLALGFLIAELTAILSIRWRIASSA
jgi:hypothetical protein